jgi:hypothetical protein
LIKNWLALSVLQLVLQFDGACCGFLRTKADGAALVSDKIAPRALGLKTSLNPIITYRESLFYSSAKSSARGRTWKARAPVSPGLIFD